MDKQLLKQILRENQQEVERYVVEPREFSLDGFPCRVLVQFPLQGNRQLPVLIRGIHLHGLVPPGSFVRPSGIVDLFGRKCCRNWAAGCTDSRIP